MLSQFGKVGRYYYLDIVTDNKKPTFDSDNEWEALERAIEDPSPYLSSDMLFNDYYPRVNAKIIAKLERFVRSISLQFTLGGHGGRLKQTSQTLSRFRNLKDEEFGTVDYRRLEEKTKDKWVKRSRKEVLDSKWPSSQILKKNFDGEWPFRSSEVIVECRDNLFCIVNINGYDFSLNGSARSRFEFPDPHNAGVAIFGRSIGPFIDLAFSLS